MNKRIKVGANDPCPCGSVKKYKQCCSGKIEWERLFRENSPDVTHFLSVRGRNMLFLESMLEALQLDSDPEALSLEKLKSAFTPNAVCKIHEAIVGLWPKQTPIESVLQSSRADVSGLYVGEYEPELLLRGVTRHSLYANKILLVDPFIHPLSVTDKFNPILHPERFRSQTLRNFAMWLPFIPWIQEGIIEFIRTPADFDHRLNWESLTRQQEKFEKNEELKAMLDEYAGKKVEEYKEREGRRMLILMAPDSYLRRIFRETKSDSEGLGEDEFIAHIHKLRKEDPYYLDPVLDESGRWGGELFTHSSGASYDMATITASMTGSYLVTDIPTRWKEIEIDRKQHASAGEDWSPLAKAFQNVNLRYLNNLDLAHALSLRNDGRLTNLRTFLRHLWTAAASENPYGQENVIRLADELEARVAEANEEWKQIDRDLLKWTGAEAAAAVTAGYPFAASGHAGFFAAGLGIAGATTLASTWLQRRGFKNKFPAAFFMDLKARATE